MRFESVGVVADDTVIMALSGRQSIYVESLLAWLAQENRPLVVPASAVVVAGWPDELATWATVTALSEPVAIELHVMMRQVGTSDLVATHVVYEATHLEWPIVTASPNRYGIYGPGLAIEPF